MELLTIPKTRQAPPTPARAEPAQIAAALAVMIALKAILSYRLLALVTLLISAGLFGYAVYDPTPFRITAATLFSVIAFFAVWTMKPEAPKPAPQEPDNAPV